MINRVKKNSGFTIFELVIVLSIIAILAAIAFPSYRDSIRKARRADAQTDLLAFANNAERIFNQDNNYLALVLPNNTDFYTYSFDIDPADSPTAYAIRATPTANQAADQCGWMSLSSTGVKDHGGGSSDCWRVDRS
jgi:type IV pilus assembly protein PilE